MLSRLRRWAFRVIEWITGRAPEDVPHAHMPDLAPPFDRLYAELWSETESIVARALERANLER